MKITLIKIHIMHALGWSDSPMMGQESFLKDVGFQIAW